MTQAAVQLLEQLRALDVRLRVEDGRLRVNAPKGSLTPALEAALQAQKQQLLAVLTEQQAEAGGRAALVPAARTGAPMRLSFLQERLWVLEQLQPGHTAYNLAVCSGELPGVDIPLLVSAIRRVVERHEILRARFLLDGALPGVQFAPAADTVVEIRDLRTDSPAERSAAIERAPREATHQPFDLAAEAPVRFTVLQTGERAAALLISAHHIAMDAWSMGVLRQEVTREYTAASSGTDLPQMPRLQYADYAVWQRAQMAGPDATARLSYWTERLAALPQMSSFPTDNPRSFDAAGTGGNHDFKWPPALYDGVRAMARELDATTYMVLLAAVAVVLTRNTGQTDVAIGSPVGTRDHADLEGMLGPILNPLVLRFDLADDSSFASVVGRARDGVLDGHQNQDVPFESLVQALNPERSLGHSPLFQVAVVLHNAPDAGAMQLHGGGAIYDLTLFATERDGVLTGSIEYRSDLYEPETIQRIEEQLEAFLTAATKNPQARVSTIPLLTDRQTTALIEAFNPAPVAFDQRTVTTQFDRIVAAHPTRVAVSAGDEVLTYAELDRRSWLVAQALVDAGAGAGSFVALSTDRSSAMVVGALGILKAGATYVPVDVTYPMERVSFMLQDSGARHIVTTGSALSSLRGIALPATVIRVDELSESATVDAARVTPGSSPQDIAYLIYTSGSTGTPKGVRIPHHALSNFLAAMQNRPGLTADDAVLSVTSMSFDISVLEVFLPLVVGARIIIATREEASDGARLARLIQQAAPTMVQSTPSGWRILMQARWEGGADITAISGGETLPRDLSDWLCSRVARLFNGFGPTETTVYSSAAQVAVGKPITVGTPVLNTRIYVLDSAGHPTPIGAPGEICIGGDGVADGYHQRPELTAARFVTDPFRTGGRMYRTGDYGAWRADGQLVHLGRADGQVKVRGYRIEIGEIENALVRHEMVRAASVAVRNASADDPRLVAWVELSNDGDCTPSELRRHLRQLLPEFMIPSMIMLVDRFPMTPNGKIDATALPDPFASAMVASREYLAPTTPSEMLIAEIWMRLLNVQRAGTSDSFFELGGHSLLAMRAASEISARTGILIEPRLLFFRTLGQLAEVCDASRLTPEPAAGFS